MAQGYFYDRVDFRDFVITATWGAFLDNTNRTVNIVGAGPALFQDEFRPAVYPAFPQEDPALLGSGFVMSGITFTAGLMNGYLDRGISGLDGYIVGFSLPAMAANIAIASAGTADDRAFLRQMLAGDDTISLHGSASYIFAGAGKDSLNGGGGYDTLLGEDGNDRVFGSLGRDALSGGEGADRLYGETGDDVLSGGASTDRLYGGTSNDRLYGGAGDDLLSAGNGADRLNGEGGNDTLYGGTSSDQLYGGTGNDSLWAGDGNDDLDGGGGADVLYGQSGMDVISGGASGDTLYGGEDADRLAGGSGDDVLSGGAGADTLTAEAGNETLVGGSGADEFEFLSSSGNARVLDFEDGIDTFLVVIYGPEDPDLQISHAGGDALVHVFDSTILVKDVAPGSITEDDFQYVVIV